MAITLLAPFRSGLPTAQASEESGPQQPRQAFEAQRLSLGRRLLEVAASERAARSVERSEAWIAGILPGQSENSGASTAYAARVRSLDSVAGIGELRALAAQAPAGDNRVLRELASVLQENDPELFADALLWMGRRYLESHPQFALTALHAAAEFSFTASRARELIAAVEGHGHFGTQFELQAPRMIRDLTSPVMLASFGSGIFLARAASLATLTRFGRLGWGSLIASEGAALAVEVPTMVLTRRFGERLLHGGAAMLAPQEIGHDLLASYGPFALLRFSGNALTLGAPWLRRNLALQGSLGARAFGGLRFGAELGSLMLGHRLNVAAGLEQPVSGSQALYQGLLSLGHMRISGRIVESLGFGSLGPIWEARRHELLRRNRDGILFGDPFQSELALAGIPSSQAPRLGPRNFLNPEPLFMVKNGDGSEPPGSSGGGGEGQDSNPPRRKALVLQLFAQNLGEYAQAAENQDSFLGKVARRLQHTLEKPELVQDSSFARALADMEAELDAVNEHGNIAKRTYAQLKILMGRGGEETALPPEVGEQVENIANDEAERGALASSLTRMKEIFQQARQFGWSEDLYAQLVTAKNRLNVLYRNSSSWKVPGLDRLLRRNDPEAMLQRRQGSLLGLAVLNGHETATVRALRDPGAPPSSDGNLELEVLHQSILTAARRSWQPEALDAEVLGLASRFGADEESVAAMLLSAATTRRLVEAGPKATDLVDWLMTRDEAHYFGDRFIQIRALRAMNPEPGQSLLPLTLGSHAADYWFTGLQLFLQSQGDPVRLSRGLEAARQSRIPGFHPSVAVSLFGAAHGRKNLPQRLWASNLDPEEYLQRALEPH